MPSSRQPKKKLKVKWNGTDSDCSYPAGATALVVVELASALCGT